MGDGLSGTKPASYVQAGAVRKPGSQDHGLPQQMFLFGMRENLVLICASGFGFFAMLPFANNCLDYLVRTNIADELQGRAWGMIGFLSQIGYVVAYGFSGILADKMSSRLQIGVGRGSALVIMAAGALLAMIALSCTRSAPSGC